MLMLLLPLFYVRVLDIVVVGVCTDGGVDILDSFFLLFSFFFFALFICMRIGLL